MMPELNHIRCGDYYVFIFAYRRKTNLLIDELCVLLECLINLFDKFFCLCNFSGLQIT